MMLDDLVERCSKISFHSYHEPFVGSAVLFFALKPKRAILSDLNGELIHFYNVFKKHPIKLYRLATGYPKTSEFYSQIRSLDVGELNDLERAARFFYLNRLCFNGIYRTNLNGKFNVPMGKDGGDFPAFSTVLSFWRRLMNSTIRQEDFELACKRARRGSFVYLDPPYDYKTRKNRGEYGVGSFGHEDLKRLSLALESLNSKGVTFLLSYLDVDDIKPITNRWLSSVVHVKRQVAAFSQHRVSIAERLISNRRELIE